MSRAPRPRLPDAAGEDPRLRSVRAALPSVERQLYLNTGTAGPMPRSAAEVLVAEVQRELEEGRAELGAFIRLLDALASLRSGFARVLGADADEIALTHHTTDGINAVVWGLGWRAGDE